jgi:hypothetical protein
LEDICAEKERLNRKIKRQERTLERDWKKIEDAWQIVDKITQTGERLFSSASILGGAELGYRIISHFLKRKSDG